MVHMTKANFFLNRDTSQILEALGLKSWRIISYLCWVLSKRLIINGEHFHHVLWVTTKGKILTTERENKNSSPFLMFFENSQSHQYFPP